MPHCEVCRTIDRWSSFTYLSGYTVHSNDLAQTSTAALFYHRLIEAFKFAYAKRSELGDPAKVNITEVNDDGSPLLIEPTFRFPF